MNMSKFESLMSKAITANLAEPDRADYWRGYMRGLRRAYFKEKFGTEEEHLLWLSLIDNPIGDRKQQGQGYRDGLAEDEGPKT